MACFYCILICNILIAVFYQPPFKFWSRFLFINLFLAGFMGFMTQACLLDLGLINFAHEPFLFWCKLAFLILFYLLYFMKIITNK